MCADEVRARCGTTGPVRLFTSPWTFGYVQNPISVYYCYDSGDSGSREGTAPADTSTTTTTATTAAAAAECECSQETLTMCVAEVTNTPWGERVVFNFEPNGQRVPKSLHVSPFMDMEGEWYVSSTPPGDEVTLRVNVLNHPKYGDYFYASYKATLDKGPYVGCRNERAGLVNLIKHGCTPHRVAYRIYAQAAAILWAGVSFYAPPGLRNVEARVRAKPTRAGMCPMRPTYRGASYWPWRT